MFFRILKTRGLAAGRIEKGSKENLILIQNIHDFTRK